MDHVVIPIGRDHSRAVEALVAEVVAAAEIEEPAGLLVPHVSVVAYEGLPQEMAVRAIQRALREAEPFLVHAHGYGFFTGDRPSDLTLHVPVVRAPALDRLHARLWEALGLAGAERAGWSAPDHWSPHLTILDRAFHPAGLGAAVTWLAHRRHPSWSIPVDQVLVTGGWPDRTGCVVPLGSP